jgi:hypothetical protein
MERLKCIRRENVRLSGVEFQTVVTPEADQDEILELLGMKLK